MSILFHSRYCIYQHSFCTGKNTIFVDNTIIISSNAANSAKCNGMHQSSTSSPIECYVVLNFVVFLIECLEIIFKI
jgi:hypothetical protein